MRKLSIGIIIIVIGIILLISSEFNFVTTEKIVDLGTIKISAEKGHSVQWSPVAGVVLVVGGIVLMAIDRKAQY